MNMELNSMLIEKNLCLLSEIPAYEFWRKEIAIDFVVIKKIRERKLNGSHRSIHTIYVDQNRYSLKAFGSRGLVPDINGLFYNFSILPNIDEIEINKSDISFNSSSIEGSLSNKRRKRRKFSSEEERRIARILKNRRTAEESRQRRIQKMRNLENYAMTSGEREKKLREEIHYLGKQNAIQGLELLLLKDKLKKYKNLKY